MTTELEGVALVRAVIEKVRAQGFGKAFGAGRVSGSCEPRPVAIDVLERARVDGDLPLTPCLREWLAFDGGLFDWAVGDGVIPGEKLGELASERLEVFGFGGLGRRLPRHCYVLPFSDREYLYFLYPSKVDSLGELPVLCAEADVPRVIVAYPGIDAFLGHHAGLLEKRWRRRLEGRIAEHQVQTFGGNSEVQVGVAEDEEPAEELPDGLVWLDEGTYGMVGDGPVPPGFWVTREAENPFTKERMRMLVKASKAPIVGRMR